MLHDSIHEERTAIQVGHLASSKHDSKFDPIPDFQEFFGFVNLGLQIMFFDIWPEPNFLVLNNFLLLLAVFQLLRFIKFVFAVIHEAANGRLSVGGDFHQIQTDFFRFLQGKCEGYYAYLFAVGINKANFSFGYFRVDPKFVFFGILLILADPLSP